MKINRKLIKNNTLNKNNQILKNPVNLNIKQTVKLMASNISPEYLGNMYSNDCKSQKISAAIPIYNRSDIILENIENIINDDRVSEIVINDDFSDDYDSLINNTKDISKIKVHRNHSNLKALKNKIKVIELCSNDWIILLDSDNRLSDTYIDVLYCLKKWDENSIYCPDFAMHQFKFYEYSNCIINRHNIKDFLKYCKFNNFINNGNFFVSKNNYLKCAAEVNDYEPYAADVMYFNYLWLKNNFNLIALRGLNYYHRCNLQHRAGSFFIKNGQKSLEHVEFLLQKFKEL